MQIFRILNKFRNDYASHLLFTALQNKLTHNAQPWFFRWISQPLPQRSPVVEGFSPTCSNFQQTSGKTSSEQIFCQKNFPCAAHVDVMQSRRYSQLMRSKTPAVYKTGTKYRKYSNFKDFLLGKVWFLHKKQLDPPQHKIPVTKMSISPERCRGTNKVKLQLNHYSVPIATEDRVKPIKEKATVYLPNPSEVLMQKNTKKEKVPPKPPYENQVSLPNFHEYYIEKGWNRSSVLIAPKRNSKKPDKKRTDFIDCEGTGVDLKPKKKRKHFIAAIPDIYMKNDVGNQQIALGSPNSSSKKSYYERDGKSKPDRKHIYDYEDLNWEPADTDRYFIRSVGCKNGKNRYYCSAPEDRGNSENSGMDDIQYCAKRQWDTFDEPESKAKFSRANNTKKSGIPREEMDCETYGTGKSQRSAASRGVYRSTSSRRFRKNRDLYDDYEDVNWETYGAPKPDEGISEELLWPDSRASELVYVPKPKRTRSPNMSLTRLDRKARGARKHYGRETEKKYIFKTQDLLTVCTCEFQKKGADCDCSAKPLDGKNSAGPIPLITISQLAKQARRKRMRSPLAKSTLCDEFCRNKNNLPKVCCLLCSMDERKRDLDEN